jgi:tRNA A-37 threonylcarbamoyl transferase component Bud32
MAISPSTVARPSGTLRVNPQYRDFLEQHGLTTPADFLALTGVIICGHPDRHVQRVTLGSGNETLTGFLKREHRVPWLSRLTNALAGVGFVSHSYREGRLLGELRCAGVAAPEWIAAGEDRDGRAFLLVREVPGVVELRRFLHGQRDAACRRSLARKLGEALAHVHDIGFDHPDLYGKHVLVEPRSLTVHLLDWQRSRRRSHVDWPRRWHDLAALHASLAEGLASPRERLACLRAYLRATLPGPLVRLFWDRAIQGIERRAQRLLRHRHIREQRQSPLAGARQRLIWLDGEALCVTPEVHNALGRQTPHWLDEGPPLDGDQRWRQSVVSIPGASHATLVRRRADWSLRWLWAWLRGKPVQSQELRQAGLLFRLQRYGIATPRLLAFGQKHYPPRRTESFLLTETPDAIDLAAWLRAQEERPLWTAERKQRWHLIRETAGVLRRMHEARCYFDRDVPAAHVVQVQARSGIVLGSLDRMHTRHRPSERAALQDLTNLRDSLPRSSWSRSDAMRFVLAYCSERRVTATVRRHLTGRVAR